jgi:hypothetical protein
MAALFWSQNKAKKIAHQASGKPEEAPKPLLARVKHALTPSTSFFSLVKRVVTELDVRFASLLYDLPFESSETDALVSVLFKGPRLDPHRCFPCPHPSPSRTGQGLFPGLEDSFYGQSRFLPSAALSWNNFNSFLLSSSPSDRHDCYRSRALPCLHHVRVETRSYPSRSCPLLQGQPRLNLTYPTLVRRASS